MNSISTIALSGLDAAMLRVQASVSNIANMRSNGAVGGTNGPAPYAPLEVREAPVGDSGVLANLAPSSRAAVLSYDPHASYANADGYVASPNVDLVSDVLQLATASYSFAANLAVIHTADDVKKSALEMRI
ncbi:MAG: flagellar basal body rod C-terminal domain-containing protein [Hyphomonadaceae bacterium]